MCFLRLKIPTQFLNNSLFFPGLYYRDGAIIAPAAAVFQLRSGQIQDRHGPDHKTYR